MSGVEVTFASDAYSADAIQRAAYRFSDRFSVEIRADGANYRCLLYSSDAGNEIGEQTLSAFRAEVLDQVLRERIANETAGIRNVVLGLAFANTGLSDDPSAAPDAAVENRHPDGAA